MYWVNRRMRLTKNAYRFRGPNYISPKEIVTLSESRYPSYWRNLSLKLAV